jgi:Outer membrane protein beta-barrel domain
MRHLLFSSVLLALAVGRAEAGPSTFYFGAGATWNTLKGLGFSINPEDPEPFDINNALSWKLLAGFRPIEYFAVEADYFGPVEHNVNRSGSGLIVYTHERVRNVAGYAVGWLPLGKSPFEAFAKVGVSDTSVKTSGQLDDMDVNKSSVQVAWGAGLQVHASRLGARVEYEEVDPNIARTSGLKVVSLSITLSLPSTR